MYFLKYALSLSPSLSLFESATYCYVVAISRVSYEIANAA